MQPTAIMGQDSRRCKLQHVITSTRNGKLNLMVTLSGDAMALAKAERELEQQPQKDTLGVMSVERPEGTDTLKITTAAAPEGLSEPPLDKPAAVMEAIFDITNCGLGYIDMRPEAIPLLNNKKTQYSMAVTVEPLVDQRDQANQAGNYSMAIIQRKLEKKPDGGCAPNPHNLIFNTLQLMNMNQQYDSAKEALQHAKDMINLLTQTYGIHKPKPIDLKLVGLHCDAIDPKRIPPEWKVGQTTFCSTRAILAGEEPALQETFRLLKGAFPRNIFHEKFDANGNLHVTFLGDGTSDPGILLKKIHSVTHCALPVKIVASVQETPDGFHPSLSAVVSKDVHVRNLADTAKALAYYIALDIKCDNRIVAPEHPDFGDPPRVEIAISYDDRDKAMERAEELREQMVAHFNARKGQWPGNLF